MSFNGVLDQKVPKRILSGALRKSLLASAYLFYGMEGTGKWALALELAKAINCERNRTQPCDECVCCRKIGRMVHPDVTVIFPVPSARSKDKDQKETERYKRLKIEEPYALVRFDRTTNIPVEQIRSLQRDIHLRPFEARRKVVIIIQAEKMHNSSANSLLKTLEEPPADAHLILTSDDVNKLLPTVISRCQQIRFSQIPAESIKGALVTDYQVEEKKASYLAQMCGGSYGRALDLLCGEKENIRQDGVRLLTAAVEGKMTPIVHTVNGLLEKWDRNSILEMFGFMVSAFRDMYMAQEGQARLINPDLAGDLLKLSQNFERQNKIDRALQTVDRIRFECQARNASHKLGLLSLSLRIKDLAKGEVGVL